MGTWLGNILYNPDDGEDGWGDEYRETINNLYERVQDLPGETTSLVESLQPGGSNELYDQTLNTTDDVAFNQIDAGAVVDGAGVSHGGELADEVTTSAVTANYTAGEDEAVLADAAGGAVTVTLPAPSASARVLVKKTDATNNVTVAQNGTETIDGATSVALTTQYESVSLVSDGTNWFIL